MIFWNTAGLLNKDMDFWKYVERFDYIGLCETWIGDKEWVNLQKRLPDSHVWNVLTAKKEKRKGRACGGILVGKSKDLGEDEGEIIGCGTEGVVHLRFKENRDMINIMMVYNSRLENNIECIIEEHVNMCENERFIIGGDFNLRIGNLGGEDEVWGVVRKSKDETIGNGGRKFLEKMWNKGLDILNGKTKGDWEGEFTCIGARGSSVIDFVFINDLIRERIVDFRIESRVDSDHMPVRVVLEKEEEGNEDTNTERRKKRGSGRDDEESPNKKEKKDSTVSSKQIID